MTPIAAGIGDFRDTDRPVTMHYEFVAEFQGRTSGECHDLHEAIMEVLGSNA